TVLITLFVLLRHTALAEISTPSLHDALPISPTGQFGPDRGDGRGHVVERVRLPAGPTIFHQSHEHPGLGQGHSQGAGMGEARAGPEVAAVDEDHRRRGSRRVTVDLDELIGAVTVVMTEHGHARSGPGLVRREIRSRDQSCPGSGEFADAFVLSAHISVLLPRSL